LNVGDIKTDTNTSDNSNVLKNKNDRDDKKNSKTKNSKNSKSDKIAEEMSEATENAVVGMEPIGSTDNIPTVSNLYAFGNILDVVNDSAITITSVNVPTKTKLRYLGFGARYIQEQVSETPRGMRFAVTSGFAIKKDNYKIPVFRAFETEIRRGKIFKYFKVFAGVDYTPIVFVNLVDFGEKLQVHENDIFWAKIGLSAHPIAWGKDLEIRSVFMKSLMVSSNQDKELEGTSLLISTYYQHTTKFGFELSYQQTYLSGDLEVESKSIGFAYVYKFEN
jgi:hypothetical protein